MAGRDPQETLVPPKKVTPGMNCGSQAEPCRDMVVSKTHVLVSHQLQQHRGAGEVLPSHFGLFLITFTRLRC